MKLKSICSILLLTLSLPSMAQNTYKYDMGGNVYGSSGQALAGPNVKTPVTQSGLTPEQIDAFSKSEVEKNAGKNYIQSVQNIELPQPDSMEEHIENVKFCQSKSNVYVACGYIPEKNQCGCSDVRYNAAENQDTKTFCALHGCQTTQDSTNMNLSMPTRDGIPGCNPSIINWSDNNGICYGYATGCVGTGCQITQGTEIIVFDHLNYGSAIYYCNVSKTPDSLPTGIVPESYICVPPFTLAK